MSRPILTERDDTMLRLLAQGLSARAIAVHVGLATGLSGLPLPALRADRRANKTWPRFGTPSASIELQSETGLLGMPGPHSWNV
jgi:hypothetical protein